MAAFSVFSHQPWQSSPNKSEMPDPRQLPVLSPPAHPSIPIVRGKQIAFQPKMSVIPPRISIGSRENSLLTTRVNSAREKCKSSWESEAMGPRATSRNFNGSPHPCEKIAVKLNLARKPTLKVTSPLCLKTWSEDNNTNSAQARSELGPNNDGFKDVRYPQSQSATSHREGWTAVEGDSRAYSDLGVFFTGTSYDWPTPPTAPTGPEKPSDRKYFCNIGGSSSDLRLVGSFGDTAQTMPRKPEKVRLSQTHRKEKVGGFCRKPTSSVHSPSSVRSLGNHSFITESGRSSKLHRREGKVPSASESGVSPNTQRTLRPKRATGTSGAYAKGRNIQGPGSVMFSHAGSPSNHCEAFEQYKKLTRAGSRHERDVEFSDGTSVDSGKRTPPPKLCHSSQQMSSSVDPVKKNDLRHRIRRGRLSPGGLSSSISRDLLDDFTSHDSVHAGGFSPDTRGNFSFTGSLGKPSEGGLSQMGNSPKLKEYMVPYSTYRSEIIRTSRVSEPQMNTLHVPADLRGHQSFEASSMSTLQTPRNKAHGMPPKQKKQTLLPYLPLQPSNRPKSMSDLDNLDPRVHSLKGEQAYLPETSSLTWHQPGQSLGRFPQSSPHGLAESKPLTRTGSPQWREALASDPVTQISMLSPLWRTPSPEPEVECNFRLQGAQLRDMAYFAYAVTGERAKFPGDVMEVVQYEPEASPRTQSDTDTADTHLSRKSEDPTTSKQGRRRRPRVLYLYDDNGHRAQKIVTYKPRNSKPRGLPPGRQMSISRSPFELNHFFLSNSFGFGRSGRKRRGRRHKGRTVSLKRTKARRTRSKSELSPPSKKSGRKTPRKVKSLDRYFQSTDNVSCNYRSEPKQSVQQQSAKSTENLSSFGPWERKHSKHSEMHRRKTVRRRRRRRRGRKRGERKKRDDSDVDDSSDSLRIELAHQTIHQLKQTNTIDDERDDKAENVLTAGMVSPGVCQEDNIPFSQTMQGLRSDQRQALGKNPTKRFSSTDKGKNLRFHNDSGNGRTTRPRKNNRSHSSTTGLKTAGRERTVYPIYKYHERNEQKVAASFRRGRNRRTRQRNDDASQRLSGSVQRSSHTGCHEGNSDNPITTAGNSSSIRALSRSGPKTTGVLSRLSETPVKTRPSGTATLRKSASHSRQAKIDYSSVPARIDTGLRPLNGLTQQNGATRDNAASVQPGPDLSGGGDSKLQGNSLTELKEPWKIHTKVDSNLDSCLADETEQRLAQRQTEELSPLKCLGCRPCSPPHRVRPTSARPPKASKENLIERTARKVVQFTSKRSDNRKAKF